jgi:hypothetical protein
VQGNLTDVPVPVTPRSGYDAKRINDLNLLEALPSLSRRHELLGGALKPRELYLIPDHGSSGPLASK